MEELKCQHCWKETRQYDRTIYQADECMVHNQEVTFICEHCKELNEYYY